MLRLSSEFTIRRTDGKTSVMRIKNLTRNTDLATRASAARSFWPRLVGLLGRRSLDAGDGLLIEPCRSVHTIFMRFPIDVVYVDRDMAVVKTAHDLRPFRVSGAIRSARSVIELPSGTIARSGTSVGDQLSIEDFPPEANTALDHSLLE